MLQILESEDHVVAVQLSGTLTEEDVALVAKGVDARLERHAKIAIFADLTDFHDLTAEAAAKVFSYSFSEAVTALTRCNTSEGGEPTTEQTSPVSAPPLGD